ncbi:hypothetical protein [Segetibacter aerophilus]|uniref:hypothetical protein n=1 Tax=Segetibacter aerophilus TaxID=670293 RepID=UPI0011BE42FA|nr:hypothetical protein [Segetibacter aerophilus]
MKYTLLLALVLLASCQRQVQLPNSAKLTTAFLENEGFTRHVGYMITYKKGQIELEEQIPAGFSYNRKCYRTVGDYRKMYSFEKP